VLVGAKPARITVITLTTMIQEIVPGQPAPAFFRDQAPTMIRDDRPGDHAPSLRDLESLVITEPGAREEG
jgi:hypothetical protein